MPENHPEPIAVIAARAADAKGGADVVILEVGPILAVCDHFVIASATNTRQVKAIAEHVEERVGREAGDKPLRIEGRDDLEWVLLDYGDLIVHVFLDETRRHYDLERLWSDVDRLAWEPDPTGSDEAERNADDDAESGFA